MIIFLSKASNTIALSLVFFYFSHNLTPSQYGGYQNFWTQFYVLNAIGSIGFSTLVFAYSQEQLLTLFTRLKARHYLLFGFFLLLVACGFGYLQLNNGVNLFLPAIIFFVLQTVSVMLDTLLTVFKKFKLLVAINFLYAFLLIGVHLFAIDTEHQLNFYHLFSGLAIIALLKCVILGIAANKSLYAVPQLQETASLPIVGFKQLWLHLYVFDVIQITVLWIDKLAVSLLLSKEISAIYQNGTFNIPFLPVIIAAVASASFIQITTTNDRKEQIGIMNNMGMILSQVVYPIFFFFLFFSEEFIVFFLSEKYVASIPIFICSLMVLPLRAFNYTGLLKRYGKGSIINKGAILDIVVALLVMYPLYVLLGLKGVALSFVISTYIESTYYLHHTARLLGVKILDIIPLKYWIFRFIFYGLLTFVLHKMLVHYFSPLPAMLIGMGILGIFIVSNLLITKKKQFL